MPRHVTTVCPTCGSTEHVWSARCVAPTPLVAQDRGEGSFSWPDGPATQKQIDYAQSLQANYWTPAVFGNNRRYTLRELSDMTRAAIGRVIDALRSERDLQGADHSARGTQETYGGAE